jgi:hypothetical protein
VDNGGSGLVVLLLGDPHLLESTKRSKNGTTNPDGVLSLEGSGDLDLDGGGGKSGDLLVHSLGNTGVHGGTSGHDNVSVEILSDINITLHDRVESSLVDTSSLKTQHGGVEEGLGSSESLVTDGDDSAIGKLVGLLERRGLGGSLELLLKVESNVTELLLDVSDDFSLGGVGERVTSLGENLHEVVGKISASHIESHDGVGERETRVDGHNVGDTITRVKNDTGDSTRGVQGEDGLDRDVESGSVESLEEDLGHLLSVGLGVDGGLGEQDGVLLRSNSELVVEGVVPDLLHVIPVGNNTVLDGVSEGQDTSLGLGLITNIGVLLAHADHDTLMSGSTDDGGENSSGSVITGETGLAHTGSVIDNEGNSFV